MPLGWHSSWGHRKTGLVLLMPTHQESGDPTTIQLSCRVAEDPLLSITHSCRSPRVRIWPFTSVSPCPEELQPVEARRQESTNSLSLPSRFHAVRASAGFIPGTPVTSTPVSILQCSLAVSHHLLTNSLWSPLLLILHPRLHHAATCSCCALPCSISTHELQTGQPSSLAKRASERGLSCH